MVCDDVEKNSILLKREDLYAILEYLPGKMVGFILPTDLLLIEDWVVKYRIQDQDKSNVQKCWLQPMPFFDKDDLPFVIASGAKSYNIINVKKGIMHVLLKRKGNHCVAQEAACFSHQ